MTSIQFDVVLVKTGRIIFNAPEYQAIPKGFSKEAIFYRTLLYKVTDKSNLSERKGIHNTSPLSVFTSVSLKLLQAVEKC